MSEQLILIKMKLYILMDQSIYAPVNSSLPAQTLQIQYIQLSLGSRLNGATNSSIVNDNSSISNNKIISAVNEWLMIHNDVTVFMGGVSCKAFFAAFCLCDIQFQWTLSATLQPDSHRLNRQFCHPVFPYNLIPINSQSAWKRLGNLNFRLESWMFVWCLFL